MTGHRIGLGRYDRRYHLWSLPAWRNDDPPECRKESVRPPLNRWSVSHPLSVPPSTPMCQQCLELWELRDFDQQYRGKVSP